MKKGFTLVELCIVLVIIGLLIGGILVAQSMINTAKIEGVVRQLSQYDAAIANFITKYNQIPGDSNLFVPAGLNTGTTNQNGAGGYEALAVWSHLSQGADLKNQLGNDYVFPPGAPAQKKVDAPFLDIDQSTAHPNYLNVQWFPDANAIGAYNYWSTYPSGSAPTIADPLLPVTALALDTKIYDGLPGSGKMTAGSWGYSNTTGDYSQCSNGGVYNTSNTTNYACQFTLEIGFATGLNRPYIMKKGFAPMQ